MNRRRDEDYEIAALSKGLMVLEALEGIGFEPVSLATIVGRTGFTRDYCYRALRTMKMRGYVAQAGDDKWSLGQRIAKFSGRYGDLALRALAQGKDA